MIINQHRNTTKVVFHGSLRKCYEAMLSTVDHAGEKQQFEKVRSDTERCESQKEKFSKCGSCLLREAMTKNNNTLYQSVSPPVETNNITSMSSIISQKLSQDNMWKLWINHKLLFSCFSLSSPPVFFFIRLNEPRNYLPVGCSLKAQ